MRRILIILAVVVLLGLAGWLGSQFIGAGRPLAEAPIISRLVAEDLPDTPDEWHGRIDYPALEQQLAELSLRPEIAGLAVAVVEDGRLSFVRSYGFADRSTGAPVTAQTVFRWASVSKTATGALADALAQDPLLQRYHLLHAVRADLLARLGRLDEASDALERAAALTGNEQERQLLDERRQGLVRR